MPFNLNDSIDPANAPANLIGQVNALAAQVKKIIGGQSWKDSPPKFIADSNFTNTMHPGFLPGRYYASPLSANREYVGNIGVKSLTWQFLPIPHDISCDAIRIQVGNISGDPVRCKMGLYKIPSPLANPSIKVVDGDEVIISSPGYKQSIFAPIDIPKGIYAIAFIIGDFNPSLTLGGIAGSYAQGVSWWHGENNLFPYINQKYCTLNGFELPSDISDLTWSTCIESPTVSIRIV